MVMSLHPDYLSSFWRLHYLLLHTDGPLASSWRHYIAIMVSLPGLVLRGLVTVWALFLAHPLLLFRTRGKEAEHRGRP